MIRPSFTQGRFVGTPSTLKLIRAQDLPSDKDMRQWYFRWCRFGGRDLSTYDLRDADILDSNMTNCELGNVDWVNFRRCNLTGVTFPADVTSYSQDIAVEILKRAPNAAHPVVQYGINFFSSGPNIYRTSWPQALFGMVRDLGLPIADIAAQFEIALAPYPKWVNRLRQETQYELHDTPYGIGVNETTPVRIRIAGGWLEDRFDADLSNVTDRWAVARAIEARVRNQRGIDIVVHVNQLDAWPSIQAVSRSKLLDAPFGWWERMWPA